MLQKLQLNGTKGLSPSNQESYVMKQDKSITTAWFAQQNGSIGSMSNFNSESLMPHNTDNTVATPQPSHDSISGISDISKRPLV